MNQQYDSQFDPQFDPSMSSNFDDINNSGLSSDSFSSHDMNSSFNNPTINLNSSYKSHGSANLSHHNNSNSHASSQMGMGLHSNNNNNEMNSTNAYTNPYGAGGDRLFMPLLNALMAIRTAEGSLQSPRGELQQICRETGLNEDMLLGTLQGVCELLGCYRLTTAISQVSIVIDLLFNYTFDQVCRSNGDIHEYTTIR